MSLTVSLLGPAGEQLAPEDLVVETLDLTADELEALRAGARRAGQVLERDDLSFFGFGTAARLELPGGLGAKSAARDAEGLLAAIDPEAVAIGALPFSTTRPGALALPGLFVLGSATGATVRLQRRRDDRRPLQELFDEIAALDAPPPPPDQFVLEAVGTHQEFRARVAAAVDAIEAGQLDKVVLAREVAIIANRPYAPEHLLSRLRRLHPSCLTFSVEGFVGASPELLCRLDGDRLVSQPLAGTVARSGDPAEDERLAVAMLSSDKERAEHAYVVNAIAAALEPYASTISVPDQPHLLSLRNVVHLASTIEATVPAGTAGCLEIVGALHPTPAVGGCPQDAALEYLAHHESLDRDRYAGPVGYLTGRGGGEFWLGIRSAILDGPRARLLAGVGIVLGSDPESELLETQLKLQALLAAAVRP